MKNLKLVGIKGAQIYECWKHSTLSALECLQLVSLLQEVNDIDRILNYNLGAIPALIINDTLVLEQSNHIPDSMEIRNGIIRFAKVHNLYIPGFLSKCW